MVKRTDCWIPTSQGFLDNRVIRYNLLLWGRLVSSFVFEDDKKILRFPHRELNFSQIERIINTPNEIVTGNRTGSRPTLKRAYEETINLGLWTEKDNYVYLSPVKESSSIVKIEDIEPLIRTLQEDQLRILLWLEQMFRYSKEVLHYNYLFTGKKGIEQIGYKVNNNSMKKIKDIYEFLDKYGYIKILKTKTKAPNGIYYPCFELVDVNLSANPLSIVSIDCAVPLEDLLVDAQYAYLFK